MKAAAVPSEPKILKKKTEIVEQKKAFHRLETENWNELTSTAKSTPPIGAPKVQDTPTATAAVKN